MQKKFKRKYPEMFPVISLDNIIVGNLFSYYFQNFL